MNRSILKELEEASQLFSIIASDHSLSTTIDRIADACVRALENGKRIIFAGNGGSAADAQHFAAELVGRFYRERRSLPAIALNTDTSMLTAIGNDYGFEHIFSRQLEGNGQDGDIFIGLSTSGCSENILHAIRYCRAAGIISVGLTGNGGGEMHQLCDHCIALPSSSTPRIQEGHTLIGHLICSEIERRLFG